MYRWRSLKASLYITAAALGVFLLLSGLLTAALYSHQRHVMLRWSEIVRYEIGNLFYLSFITDESPDSIGDENLKLLALPVLEEKIEDFGRFMAAEGIDNAITLQGIDDEYEYLTLSGGNGTAALKSKLAANDELIPIAVTTRPFSVRIDGARLFKIGKNSYTIAIAARGNPLRPAVELCWKYYIVIFLLTALVWSAYIKTNKPIIGDYMKT